MWTSAFTSSWKGKILCVVGPLLRVRPIVDRILHARSLFSWSCRPSTLFNGTLWTYQLSTKPLIIIFGWSSSSPAPNLVFKGTTFSPIAPSTTLFSEGILFRLVVPPSHLVEQEHLIDSQWIPQKEECGAAGLLFILSPIDQPRTISAKGTLPPGLQERFAKVAAPSKSFGGSNALLYGQVTSATHSGGTRGDAPVGDTREDFVLGLLSGNLDDLFSIDLSHGQ